MVTEDHTHGSGGGGRVGGRGVDAELTDSAGGWRTGSADGGGGRLAVRDEDTSEGGGGRGTDTFFFFVITCFVRPAGRTITITVRRFYRQLSSAQTPIITNVKCSPYCQCVVFKKNSYSDVRTEKIIQKK